LSFDPGEIKVDFTPVKQNNILISLESWMKIELDKKFWVKSFLDLIGQMAFFP